MANRGRTREQQRLYMKKYRAENPRVTLNVNLKAAYGITLKEYEVLEKQQNYVCAICGGPESKLKDGVPQRLSVDHCHTGGHVRGLLCGTCNSGLGYFKDDVALLQAAVAYLLK